MHLMGSFRRLSLGSRWVTAGLLTAVSAFCVAGNAGFHEPPRYDGAGYAVLAEAIATGRGYREIDHPASPRHAHFPPGYPALLSIVWRTTHRSVAVAHLVSLTCTVGATIAAWLWFRSLYAPRVADLLGFALAVNWTWGRAGASIQSEPLFLLISQLAILTTVRTRNHGGIGPGLWLGVLTAGAVLTRHVGAALAVAIGLDLVRRGRYKTAIIATATWILLVLPWLTWLLSVGEKTQAGLLTFDRLSERLAAQSWFYLQRIPDQLTGPVVEVGTVFRNSIPLAAAVNIWAVVATGTIVLGWLTTFRTARRRLVGIVAVTTLALLLVWPFTEAGRFLIPLVPCLLVGATEGIARLVKFIHVTRPRTFAAAVLLALSTPYSVYALATGRAAAQRGAHGDFDAACDFLLRQENAGPVLTRHPGEIFWLTGRHALEPGPDLESLIDKYGVAYLVIDDERYANAPSSPLEEFVGSHPERVPLMWRRSSGGRSIRVYAVVRVGQEAFKVSAPRSEEDRNPRSGGNSAAEVGPSS